jgi:hypothetical protein
MNWLKYLVALACLGCVVAFSASEEKVTHYVQLIRGNNEQQPPAPGAKPVGPKLSKSLQTVFRWNNYWEITRQEVVVVAGTKTKVVLTKERAVEIDLTQPMKRTVTAISNNKSIGSTTQPSGNFMTIIGADRDPKSAWFVVVRRDKPTLE